MTKNNKGSIKQYYNVNFVFFWNFFVTFRFECIRRENVLSPGMSGQKYHFTIKLLGESREKKICQVTKFSLGKFLHISFKTNYSPELMSKNVPVLRIEAVFTADSTIFNFQQPMKTRDLFSTANENP